MTYKQIKVLCDKWTASGRLSFIYKRRLRVSLNGMRSITFEEAAKKIKEVLS